jgi:hypothetical protein
MINNIAFFLKALWLYITGIIGLLIIYFLLTSLEQGIDVVIQVGEFSGPVSWSLICIVLWAFLEWYSARLLSYAKQYNNTDIPTKLLKHFPRIIAFNTFVAIQTAIFSLPSLEKALQTTTNPNASFYYLHGWGIWLFIIAHNALYFLLSSIWELKEKNKYTVFKYVAIIILSGCYIAWIIYAIFRHNDCTGWRRHTYWLPWVALGLFVLEIIAVFLFIFRRKAIDRHINNTIANPDNLNKNTFKRLSLNPRFDTAEKNHFKVFHIIAIGSLLLYIIVIKSLLLCDRFGPLALVLLALGVLTAFFNLVSYFSIKLNFNLNFLFWIWAFILGKFYDPYNVRLLPAINKEYIFHNRPSVEHHLHNWLQNRESILDKADSGKFEVYIVLSNGGASRSGNWVASILSKLQDSSYHKDTSNSFAKHLLCMAGASGGTVGNSVFYSLLKAQQNNSNKITTLYPHAYSFFSTDFLTYTLGYMMGPDFFRHIIPVAFPKDRAAALENTMMEDAKDSLVGSYFGQPLQNIYDTTGALPVLFINSTRVDNGMPGEISSIKLPLFSQRIDMLSLVDSTSDTILHNEKSLRFATAAILSARFPYVSPAGQLYNHQYFVDGGYFDNSGAGIVLEYLQNINEILQNSTDPLIQKSAKKFHFIIIQINNGSTVTDKTPARIHPLVNDLLSPLLTLGGIQGSSTKVANCTLNNYLLNMNHGKKNSFIPFNLYDSAKDKEEDYPMSWVISDYNLERMHRRADTVIDSNYCRINFNYRAKQ